MVNPGPKKGGDENGEKSENGTPPTPVSQMLCSDLPKALLIQVHEGCSSLLGNRPKTEAAKETGLETVA